MPNAFPLDIRQVESLTAALLDADETTSYLTQGSDCDGSLLSVQVRAMVEALAGHLRSLGGDGILALYESLPQSHRFFVEDRTALAAAEGDAAATRVVARYWLELQVSEQLRRPPFSPSTPIGESRVLAKFPELKSHVTDEEMVLLSGSGLKFDAEGIRHKGHVIRWHRWLGHSGLNDPGSDIISFLCDHAQTTDNRVEIAVDGQSIIPDVDRGTLLMEDYWWGRQYSRGDLDKPHALGVTVHGAPAVPQSGNSYAACVLGGIVRAEFRWSSGGGGIKTFEAEEVLDAEARNRPRYMHAEYDLTAKAFRHMDGALMFYSEADEARRREPMCFLPATPRAASKPKLFRVDGQVSVRDFSQAACLYYRSNPLIREYFEGAGEAHPD